MTESLTLMGQALRSMWARKARNHLVRLPAWVLTPRRPPTRTTFHSYCSGHLR